MKLRVESTSGAVTNLTIQKIISIDGVPFSDVAKSAGVDLDTLHKRLTIAESALAGMLEQWTEFMNTAVVVETADSNGDKSDE